MKLNQTIKVFAAAAALSVGQAAMAADVYCPGDPSAFLPAGTGFIGSATGNAPNGNDAPAGYNSYVFVEGGLAASCYYRAGNLDAGGPGDRGWDDFGIGSYLVKYPDDASNPALLSFTGNGVSSGTFTLGAGVSLTSPLYIGFHFGGGTGNPDSFIVQLDAAFFLNPANGRQSDFAFTSANGGGLSNIYLFAARCSPNDPSCQTTDIPEPGSLALLGAGLVGLALMRRRRRI